jgi:hypothetical protein
LRSGIYDHGGAGDEQFHTPTILADHGGFNLTRSAIQHIQKPGLMPIWKVKPIAEAPELILDNWTIFEVSTPLWPGKTRHFVGYNVGDREGRVSSEIAEFDVEKMLGKTRSGRVYKLSGRQGDGSSDGLHTWGLWCRRNKIAECQVVGAELLAEMELEANTEEAHEAVADEPVAGGDTEITEEKRQLSNANEALLHLWDIRNIVLKVNE